MLRELNSGAEPNIAETRAELAEEAELLERVVLEALDDAGAGAGAVAIPAAALAAWEPGLRRLALRALAERAAGRQVPLGRERAAEIVRLAARPEGGTVELGGGLRRDLRGADSSASAPPPSTPRRRPRRSPCALPGWRGSATGRCAPSFIPARSSRRAPTSRRSTRARSTARLEVRTWREGDRIRPLGMRGTKTLGDLFTDGGVPRSLRHALPVVTVDGEVAWVAGVAVSDDFRLEPDDRPGRRRSALAPRLA